MGILAFDNRTRILKDDLVRVIHKGDAVSVAESVLSMYAFNELTQKALRRGRQL